MSVMPVSMTAHSPASRISCSIWVFDFSWTSSMRTGWMRPSEISRSSVRRAISRRIGSKHDEHDRLGGVVDDQVRAGGGLEGPDVPALTTDDAALHVLVRQRDGRHRRLAGELGGDPLHRDRDDLAGPLVAFLAGRGLDVPDDRHGVPLGLVLDLLDQGLLGVLGGHAGDPLELATGPLGDLVDLLPGRGELGFLRLDRLLSAVEADRSLIEGRLPLGDAVFLLVDLDPAGLEVRLGLGAHLEDFVLRFD